MASKIMKFWEFKLSAEKKSADLYINGPILEDSWFDEEAATPKRFKKDFETIGDVDEINLYINSRGGDAFAGIAIYNMLRSHGAHINAIVNGLAASAASIILMAGHTRKASLGSMVMVHKGSVCAVGNATFLRKVVDRLDKLDESATDVYAEATGLKRDEIEKMLEIGTWLTAKEAYKKGFVDEIDKSLKAVASLESNMLNMNGQKFDISGYDSFPRGIFQNSDFSQAQTNEGQGVQEDGHPSVQASVDEAGKNNTVKTKKMKGVDSMDPIEMKIGDAVYKFADQGTADAFVSMNTALAKTSQLLETAQADIKELQESQQKAELQRRNSLLDAAKVDGILNVAMHEKYVALAAKLDATAWADQEEILTALPKIVEKGKDFSEQQTEEQKNAETLAEIARLENVVLALRQNGTSEEVLKTKDSYKELMKLKNEGGAQ